jgi:hypothetical protein
MRTQTFWQKTQPIRYRLGRLARGNSYSVVSEGATEPDSLVSKTLKPTSAQALVEFIYVSIPMLMLFIGILEFGVVFWNNQRLELVTREFARRTAICANGCDAYKEYGFDGDPTNNPDVFVLSGIWSASSPPLPPTPIQPQNWYFIDPARINYIWIQRISPSGNITPNAALGETAPIIARPNTTTPDGTYGRLFVMYRYNAARSPYAPFSLDTASPSPAGYTRLNKGYPSAGYNVGSTRYIGRSACEPTHRFWVEVQWRHNWISPVQFLPMGNIPINLTNRRAMKIEPQQFPLEEGGSASCLNE